MNPGDELHLVEYDSFAEALTEKYKHLKGKVFVHHDQSDHESDKNMTMSSQGCSKRLSRHLLLKEGLRNH